MIEIKVEGDKALAQLDEVIKRMAGLEQETTTEFVKWQGEDMHRHYPKVDGSGLSVSTTIYPRSPLPRKKQPGAAGKPRRRRPIIRSNPAHSHRPILRPELFEKLKERMIAMIKGAMTWQ